MTNEVERLLLEWIFEHEGGYEENNCIWEQLVNYFDHAKRGDNTGGEIRMFLYIDFISLAYKYAELAEQICTNFHTFQMSLQNVIQKLYRSDVFKRNELVFLHIRFQNFPNQMKITRKGFINYMDSY
jgi:DNA replicative helicase MCM subunit Mcm2 (Cdc46/Mcm family)